jgi:uncharacterized membrane protein YbhN (UPF0104 family)
MADTTLVPTRWQIALRDYRLRIASSAIALLIMTALVAVMLSQIEFSAIATAFRAANPLWIASASLLFLLGQALRVLRTHSLLNPHMALARPTTARAVLGGQVINWLSPIRVGDVWRILKTCEGDLGRLAWTIAGVVVEKSSDALVLAVFALALIVAPLPVAFSSPLSRLLLTGLAGMLLATAVTALTSSKAQQKIAQRLPKAALLFRFASDAAQSRDIAPVANLRATWLRALPLSIAIWVCGVCANAALAQAFGIQIGIAAHLLLMLALQTSTVFSPVPGNVGVQAIVAVSILTPLGITSAQALAFGAVLWVLAYGALAVLAACAALWRRPRLNQDG